MSEAPHYTRRNGDGFIGKVIKLWPIFLAIVSVTVMATTHGIRLDDQSKAIQDHETRLRSLESTMADVKSDTHILVRELVDRKHHREDK